MKEIIRLFLTICICICALSGCAPASAPWEAAAELLTDKGIELICKVDKLAECKEFTDIYTANTEIAAIIQKIADNDYSDPQGVFAIEDADALVLKSMMTETRIPDDIARMLRGRFASALPSQITAMNGASSIAAVSILSYGESFLCEGVKKPVTYLYTYGNDYSFMVNYIPNDENIVAANVTVVINADLSKCTSQEAALAFLSDALSYEDISVSMVTKEE